MATPTPAATSATFMVISNGAALGTGPGNVNQLCMFRTNNTLAELETAGYFNNVALDGLLKIGDIIISQYDADGTTGMTMHIVSGGNGTTDITLTQTDLA